MKTQIRIWFTAVSLTLLVTFSANLVQHYTIQKAHRTIQLVKTQQKTTNHTLKQAIRVNKVLTSQLKSDALTPNSNRASEDFNRVSNNFFAAMYNFTPNSYTWRKKAVQGLISKTLFQRYFPAQNYSGDSNSVTAKLNRIAIYMQTQQGQTLKGLALITFESKSGNHTFKKETVLYQLTFDVMSQRLSQIQNLGGVLEASDVS